MSERHQIIDLMYITDPITGRQYVSKRRRRFDEERMPRELTFSCYHRLPLLDRDRSRQWFIDALNDVRQRWPVELWGWVIMPEHVHLLVSPREAGVSIGQFQGEVKERAARPAIAWLQEHAPDWLNRITVQEGSRTRRRFWQPGGGYDRNMIEIETLYAALDYIHMNPVKRGLATRPEDWKWSSAAWYAGVRPALIEMDATLPPRVARP